VSNQSVTRCTGAAVVQRNCTRLKDHPPPKKWLNLSWSARQSQRVDPYELTGCSKTRAEAGRPQCGSAAAVAAPRPAIGANVSVGLMASAPDLVSATRTEGSCHLLSSVPTVVCSALLCERADPAAGPWTWLSIHTSKYLYHVISRRLTAQYQC